MMLLVGVGGCRRYTQGPKVELRDVAHVVRSRDVVIVSISDSALLKNALREKSIPSLFKTAGFDKITERYTFPEGIEKFSGTVIVVPDGRYNYIHLENGRALGPE